MLAYAIAKYLASKVDGLTYDEDDVAGNVFVGWMPETPDVCVAVMAQPGLANMSKSPTMLPGIQLIVRNAVEDTGYTLALACQAELDCLDQTVLDPGGPDEVRIITSTATTSDPASMGRDENERCEWSVNLQLRIVRPTELRPNA